MTLAITAGTIYSTLGNNNSLVPMAIKDIANSTGLTAGSYITGDKLEGKDRFLDEFGTQAIWLFGIPVYKKLMDYTMYKALKIDPTFDVRNLSKNRSKLLEKSIEYADSSIKESMIKASKNPKYTKNLAMTKFIVSTALTIASYAGLTKYRHYKTKQDAEKEILAEELGHYYCNALYYLNSDNIQKKKCEYRAMKWAYSVLVPFQKLKEKLIQGFNLYELADYFNVDCKYMIECVNFYVEKYGILV